MSNDLLHEIERLNKVVEDLQNRNEVLDGAWTTVNKHRDALKAENERLRDALKEVHDNAVGHWIMQKEQLSMIDSIACQALEHIADVNKKVTI